MGMVSLSARSITYSIDVWARRYEVGPEDLQKLCEMIAASKIPGFDVVQIKTYLQLSEVRYR